MTAGSAAGAPAAEGGTGNQPPSALLSAMPGTPAWNRLRWRAGRRGMKELDVLFARYLEHGWTAADAAERRAFLDLLELQDPDLARICLAHEPVDDPARAALVAKLTDGRYARL